jgi:rod shape-determining protein MreB
LRSIIEAIKDVVEESPPELVSDIAEKGIYLTGGGALLKGLPQLLVKEIKMPVTLVEDPLTTVVRGTVRILEDQKLLKKTKFAGSVR